MKLELISLPLSHKYLPGHPYKIGDEYELIEKFKRPGYKKEFVKVKRIHDGYIETLSMGEFKEIKNG